MTAVAILVANAHYMREQELACCLEDLAAVEALIRAAGMHDVVAVKADAAADEMRDVIRNALPASGECNEVFFYFSGHGAQIGPEFYYCGTNFHGDRPNETSLSQAQLHDLVRSANPNLFVKVVDACFSGTLLVKSDRLELPIPKEGFRHVVQIASSLNDQTSLGGEPLSDFTRGFCEACTRKKEGPIYYSDIVNTLRDDFLENDDQTPFFVSQWTGRDLFVEDASKLAQFRDQLATRWSRHFQRGCDPRVAVDQPVPLEPPSMQVFFEKAEERIGGADVAATLINSLFDDLVARVKKSECAKFFEITAFDSNNYYEPTAREFMIRVLSRETRPDRLVTAELKDNKKKSPFWSTFASSAMSLLPDVNVDYDLQLNCNLARAQLRITLNPKYRSLQQVRLVVSCAPSLEHCYIFEIATQHPRTSWDNFGDEGREVVRRWYKQEWNDSTDDIVQKITTALESAVQAHMNETASRLGKAT